MKFCNFICILLKVMINKVNALEHSLANNAADEIIKQIKTLELKPGDKIPSEPELCKSLGVSRSTLREAIKILVSRNILTITRGVGTFVSKTPGITEDPLGFDFVANQKQLLLDLLQFRLFLEPPLAELAAQNATESEIEKLIEIEKKLEQAYIDSDQTAPFDIEFHSLIAKCSHNMVVEILFPVLFKTIPVVRSITKKNLMQDTFDDHNSIIEAIKRNDCSKAKTIMTQHVERNIQFIRERTDD